MPSIKDESTVEAIAQEFTSNGRNKTETLKTIGYTPKYTESRGLAVVFGNVRVKAAIARIDAKRQAKNEHNYDISVEKLLTDYENLKEKAATGDIQAIQARTAIIRELNDISGLHKQVIRQEIAAPTLTEAERAALPDAAHTYKLRLAKGS